MQPKLSLYPLCSLHFKCRFVCVIVTCSVNVNTKNNFVTIKTKLDILNSMFSVLIPGLLCAPRTQYLLHDMEIPLRGR